MHAYRKGRTQLVLFDDVDMAVLVERVVDGETLPVPFVIRAADKKAPVDIHREIHLAQREGAPQALAGTRWLRVWLLLPGFVRRFAWTMLLGNPHWRKITTGTVLVTAVGMFGRGPAWGIPLTNYTLCVTAGGLARKPGVVRGSSSGRGERIEVREYLSLTLSVDHDIMDGAPMARFASRLKELIETSARRLEEQPSGVHPAL